MKFLKYFFQFIIIYIFFLICKIIGYKNSSDLGSLVGGFFGPFFRSKKVIDKNAILESLISFKRSGANAIVSYYADRLDKILE